jgi:hypothetical protein
MAQLINEAKRMQLLAGLITESQLNEGIKTIDANSRDFKVEGNEYLKLTDLKPGVIIAKNKSYSDKAELEGEAGEFEKVENDYIHWKTKNGKKQSWNASYIDDLVLVKNLEESQLNEGWDDFNATGWMARIKDLAKEMGYDASTGWDDQNTDRARLQAADEAGKGEKKAYIGTVDDGNTIVVTFTLDKDNKDQNKANIQKKIVDLYKNDANVSLGRQTHGDTLMQVIIKDKTKSQPQQESIEQAVNEALARFRRTGK